MILQEKKFELPKKLLRFILHFVKPHSGKIACLFFVSTIWAIDLSFRPYMMKVILDTVTRYSPEQGPLVNILMWPVLLYLLSLLCLNFVFRFYDAVRLYMLPSIQADIIGKMMQYIEYHAHDFFQKNFSGAIASQVKEMSEGVKEIIKIFINKFFSHTLAIGIATFTAASVHPILAAIILIWATIFLWVTTKISRGARQKAKTLSKVKSITMGSIVDSLTNISSVRLFARNEDELLRLNNQLEHQVDCGKKLEWSMLRIRAFQGFSVFFMISLLLTFLVYARQQNLVSVGDFAFIISISISISEAIWNISDDLVTFSELVGRCNQALSLIEESHKIQDSPTAKPLVVPEGAISFDFVSFFYRPEASIFNNLSTIIHAKQRVGLVGFSGAGKSTFVNLITRTFDIQSGSILIDGQDIKHVTQKSLREHISFIPQDTILFHRTFMENIAYGSPKASEEAIIWAAKKAYAHDFIITTEHGYQTTVGERGIKISGGQRQRIAIARAFLKNAPILILDEATSSLDSETEAGIQDSLQKLMHNRTTIVIAHRLSTLMAMDRILVFDAGCIVEDGTHQELIQHAGIYARLWNAQAGKNNNTKNQVIVTGARYPRAPYL